MLKPLLIPVFSVLLISLYAQQPRVIKTNSTNTILPEGIAIDITTGNIFISSINEHKILLVDDKGNSRDFIKNDYDDFFAGVGVKVDNKRNILWALSNKKSGKTHSAQLHGFDIQSSTTRYKFFPEDTVSHFFNDLIIHSNGKLFITDTEFGAVYEFDPATTHLTLFAKDTLLAFPNGITEGNNGIIYIATYSHGLLRLNPLTKELNQLTGYTNTAMAFGLDGLVTYKHSIIGVYNIGTTEQENAVVQYMLSDDGEKIIAEKIIDKGNPYFATPTTAALAGNKLYVLANSHIAEYNNNKESVTGIENKLQPVNILVYRLAD